MGGVRRSRPRDLILLGVALATACTEADAPTHPDASVASHDAAVRDAALPDDAAPVDAAPDPPTLNPDASAEAGSAPDARLPDAEDAAAAWPLGMNDVTIIAPLPEDVKKPVLLAGTDLGADGQPLVPRALFDRLTEPGSFGRVLPPEFYERFQLVALRFDLCDRSLPGPCLESSDARLRLVWQPIQSTPDFYDGALHTFFAIPRAQLGTALTRLRELAQRQAEPVSSALVVSPALVRRDATYVNAVRSFVRDHASQERLVRLTLNAQDGFASAVRWVFRGVERRGQGPMQDIVLVNSTATKQELILAGDGFDVMPAIDTPPGLSGALSSRLFGAASEPEKSKMRGALVAVNNPLLHAPDTTSCVACHTSTLLLPMRTGAGMTGGYESRWNLSIDAGKSRATQRSIRALGYLSQDLMISERVANETAQVLEELWSRGL